MNLSRAVCLYPTDDGLIATAQKIAVYTVIPFALIVSAEAVLKNLIGITYCNCAIALINAVCFLVYPPFLRAKI